MPKLSRPAAKRRPSANITEGLHFSAALMWGGLDELLRHLYMSDDGIQWAKRRVIYTIK